MNAQKIPFCVLQPKTLKFVASIKINYFLFWPVILLDEQANTELEFSTLKNRYGNWYRAFKINSNTTWYISFNVEGDEYNITHITNNHTADYVKYIR